MLRIELKTVLIVILLFACIKSFAQNGKTQFAASYDQVFFPFYNYDYHENEFSYRLSGDVTYYISNWFSIASGISYESNKFLIVYPPSNTSALRIVEEKYDYSYVGIPIIFGFDLWNAKSQTLAVRSGFELIRLIDSNGVITYNDGSTRNSQDDSESIKYSNCFSFGVNYCYFLIPKLFIGITPKVRYNLSSHMKSNEGSRALSYLLQFSIGYELTK